MHPTCVYGVSLSCHCLYFWTCAWKKSRVWDYARPFPGQQSDAFPKLSALLIEETHTLVRPKDQVRSDQGFLRLLRRSCLFPARQLGQRRNPRRVLRPPSDHGPEKEEQRNSRKHKSQEPYHAVHAGAAGISFTSIIAGRGPRLTTEPCIHN